MTPTLLMIRGCPGSGKITVARLLSERLGWKLFWLHDLDPIFRIIEDHRDARFIDQTTAMIVDRLLRKNPGVIFVRPAREKVSVDAIDTIVRNHRHKFFVVRLTAKRETLTARVEGRDTESQFRIDNASDLATYMNARHEEQHPKEIQLSTDGFSAEQVADAVQMILEAA